MRILTGTLVPQHAQRSSGLGDEIVDIERFANERNALRFRARQQEHRINETLQASGLFFDDCHRLSYSCSGRAGLRKRHLCSRADDRDRCSEVVRGVGHELPLAVKGRCEPFEHGVEGTGQETEFIVCMWRV